MAFGEKLKEARIQFGLSQEELAKKIYVSRAAIAKWETGGGVPDVENLKIIASFLQVSTDYLLDDNAPPVKYTIKEQINFDDYGEGSKNKKFHKIVMSRYPEAEIHYLVVRQKLTKSEKVVDNLLGWLTPAPFGIPDMLNSLKLQGNYYLVTKNERQYLVNVTKISIESKEIAFKVSGKKFELDNLIFQVGFLIK